MSSPLTIENLCCDQQCHHHDLHGKPTVQARPLWSHALSWKIKAAIAQATEAAEDKLVFD